MIVDWYFPDDSFDTPSIYLRTRDAFGNLNEEIINPDDEKHIRPFCWVPKSTPNWQLNRLYSRHPSARIIENKTAIGIDDEPLMKLEVDKPNELYEIKQLMPTYEADLNYKEQILLQLYPDKVPDFHPRVWYFDLEWDTKEDFTSVMAVVDSDLETPVVFAWADETTNCPYDDEYYPTTWTPKYQRTVRDIAYQLHHYKSEAEMHEGFINFLHERDPDILVAHALMWADLPHLIRRLEEPDQLSPLNQVIRPFKNEGYQDTQQPIKGRLCWDSAAHWQSGSGFETLWQKSGRGQLPNRKLNTIAELLDLGSKLTEEIEGMTVHNGWYEYWDDFVDYCLLDTTLLRDISNRLNAIEFFVAMQQLCGVSWESTHNVTRYFRGLVGRRTEKKAKSASKVKREALKAAHIPDPIPGRHEGVAAVDYASLYPNIITSDNLCFTTKRSGPGPNIKTLGNGTHWDQTKKGLLPSIVDEMLELRREYKKKMKEAKTPEERLGYDMLQTAAKVAVNALYGMTGMKSIQGMWVDNDIASSITFRGREAIHHLLKESEEQGFKSLYGHTDSAFIQVPFDEAQALAEHLTKTAKEMLDLPYMDVELEAYFDYWITASVKNRYFGYKVWPESEKGQLKVTGYAIKASSSAPITKRIQSVAMKLIGHGADEEEVSSTLRKISLEVKNGTIPLADIIQSTRLTKPPHEYDKPTPGAKAAMHYNEHIKGDKWKKGDSVSWTYIANTGTLPDYFTIKGEKKRTQFMAFRDIDELDSVVIDWEKILDVLVKKKLKRLYESVGWDIAIAAGDIVPETYW